MRRTPTASLLAALTLTASGALAQTPNPDKDAYFGETHVHTSWSLDAFAIGNTLTTPGDAYKYFKGEPIKHPLGYDVKIDTPLDFAGVTDHSEYAGIVQLANDPKSPVSKIPQAVPLILKAKTKEEMERVALYAITHARPRPAGQGADVAGNRRRGLEEEHRARQPGEPARKVHGVLLVRVDLDAEQHEPPPQRLLQGVLARPGHAVQRARLLPPGRPLELDGRPAQGRQRAARDLAQRQSLGRPHVSRPTSTARDARSTRPTPPRGRATSR